MDDQRNRGNNQNHLGVHKMGKNIRKDQSNHPTQQHNPQALVYNINKIDFRSTVQQLTGLGSSSSSVNPPQNPQKQPNSRLFKVRPAPLTQVNRPPPPPPVQSIPIASQSVQPNQFSVNPVESPISAYMRYLIASSPVGTQNQNQKPVQSSTGLFPPFQTGPTQMSLPSPASQFVLSPPPRSPFPLFSPNFAFSPRVFGGGESLPPPSPGFFFPLLSPLWKKD